jgi:hypothetical protein
MEVIMSVPASTHKAQLTQEKIYPEEKTETQGVSKTLIAIDHFFDVLPLGSTASNLVNICLKHTFIDRMDPNQSSCKEYVSYLKDKKTTTCLTYGLPVLGNLLKLGVLSKKAIDAVSSQKEEEKEIELNVNAYQTHESEELERRVTI